jgi:hypothetical protein
VNAYASGWSRRETAQRIMRMRNDVLLRRLYDLDRVDMTTCFEAAYGPNEQRRFVVITATRHERTVRVNETVCGDDYETATIDALEAADLRLGPAREGPVRESPVRGFPVRESDVVEDTLATQRIPTLCD